MRQHGQVARAEHAAGFFPVISIGLDVFHVVKLATAAVEETWRRVQQETTGHRGRKHDPLYRVGNILRAGAEHLN